MIEAYDTLIERPKAPRGRFSLMDEMFVERGTKDDWTLLHDLHYKAETLPAGARFWKTTLHGETIAVLVSATPRGMLKERHLMFPAIKPDGRETTLTNTDRYNWLNANTRVISRFVNDTLYRGIGAGYRMMNLVSRMEQNTIMEIQSSMSKFNYFGQKAGFRFCKPMNANKYEQGLKFMRQHFAANPQDIEAVIAEIEGMKPILRDFAVKECRAFYLRHSSLENTGNNRNGGGERRVAAMDARQLIKAIQQMCLASPMYGAYRNPDKGRVLPERLPLLAFDRQLPTEPLVL